MPFASRPSRKAPDSWRLRPRRLSSLTSCCQRRALHVMRCSGARNARIVALIEKLINLLQITNDTARGLPQAARMLAAPLIVAFDRHAIARQVEALPVLPGWPKDR